MIILELIKKKHEISGGHNGYSLNRLCEDSGLSKQEIREAIKELRKQGKVKIREGINQNLVFYEQSKHLS